MGHRLFTVGIVVALTVAFIGLVTSTNAPGPPVVGRRPAAKVTGAEKAPSYVELRDRRRGANANMYVGAVSDLSKGLPPLTDRPPARDAVSRGQALAARRLHRAFNGAPPTIPHPVDSIAVPNCLACHERGAVLAGKVAPAMSHRRLDNCTQCHVTFEPPAALGAASKFGIAVANTFAGEPQSARGARAFEGAPPVVPHATFMREACATCHGVAGAFGLRTPHVDRQSCSQCHPPSAELDQRPMPIASSETP